MEKFIIRCFGCSRRDLDGERIKDYFFANNLERTGHPDRADYLVVVTCGLTQYQTDKSIKCIENFKKKKGKLLVYGCLPAMNPEIVKMVYSGRTLLTKDIEAIDDFFNLPVKFKTVDDVNKPLRPMISECVMEREAKESSLMIISEISKALRHHWLFSFFVTEGIVGGIGFNNRFFSLRIAEGCAGNCSYCTIKKAIGVTRSKPISVILTELRRALQNKQYRVNLLSSDAGSYGIDRATTLPELLEAILEEDESVIIEFIQDLNPFWICYYKERFIELVKTGRIRSILCPIQSGNPRILKLMNRHVDLDEFAQTIRQIKEVCPKVKLRTQIIVGFPTETDAEFTDSVTYVRKCKFDQVDIFGYFEVHGSCAEGITPKVPPKIIMERIKRLDKEISSRIVGSTKIFHQIYKYMHVQLGRYIRLPWS